MVDQPNKQEDSPNLEWNTSQEQLLREWAEVAGSYRWLHYKAHMWFRTRNLRYMVPLIIMSTLTGTANFAQGTFPESFTYVPEIIGGINLIAAILTTLYQFLKISEMMESHRITSINFGKFNRNLTVELALPQKDRSTSGKELIKLSRNEVDRLIEQSPTIPKHILRNYEKKFEHLKLSKPEIISIRKVDTYTDKQLRLHKCSKGTDTESIEGSIQDYNSNNSNFVGRSKSFVAINHAMRNSMNNVNNLFRSIMSYIRRDNSTISSPRKNVEELENNYEDFNIDPRLPVFTDIKDDSIAVEIKEAPVEETISDMDFHDTEANINNIKNY